MKKHSYLSLAAAMACAFAVGMPLFANAQTLMDTGAATDIGASLDSGPAAGGPQNLRDALKARIQAETGANMNNVEHNENYRNAVLTNHPNLSSTTSGNLVRWRASTTDARGDIRDQRIASATDIRIEARVMMRDASSTIERWGIRRDARADEFRIRQTALVQQLQLSLDNLSQIRVRIAARISLETNNGRDMTEAQSLLATADQKIAAAQAAVSSIASYVPTATSTDSITASTTIDLGRPREIGAGAIKAVNDARQALQQVVTAIARVTGFGIGQDGHIIASTTITTSSSTQ